MQSEHKKAANRAAALSLLLIALVQTLYFAFFEQSAAADKAVGALPPVSVSPAPSAPVRPPATTPGASAAPAPSPTAPARPIVLPPIELNPHLQALIDRLYYSSDGRLNVNIAGKAQLLAIEGIGEPEADNILEHRRRIGGAYTSLEQVRQALGWDERRFSAVGAKLMVPTADFYAR